MFLLDWCLLLFISLACQCLTLPGTLPPSLPSHWRVVSYTRLADLRFLHDFRPPEQLRLTIDSLSGWSRALRVVEIYLHCWPACEKNHDSPKHWLEACGLVPGVYCLKVAVVSPCQRVARLKLHSSHFPMSLAFSGLFKSPFIHFKVLPSASLFREEHVCLFVCLFFILSQSLSYSPNFMATASSSLLHL